jgi:uncharacterized ParB-like nuclease family protein
MKITGKLNKVSNGQYGVGILVTGHTGFINTKDSLAAVEANAREGDFVEVDVQEVHKNGKTYYNFKADGIKKITADQVVKNRSAKKEESISGMVRGMAFNNAVAIAIAEDKTGDDQFLIDTTVRLYNLQPKIEDTLSNPAPVSQEAAVEETLDNIDFGEAV